MSEVLKNNEKLKGNSIDIPKLGIPEIDNLGFGLNDLRDQYLNDYRRSYRQTSSIRRNTRSDGFGLYNNITDGEFGVFKQLKKYKTEEYCFSGLRNILGKYLKRYKFPNLTAAEKQIIGPEVKTMIKELFLSCSLEPQKEGENSAITKENLTKVFYMLFLISIYEKSNQEKYIQQKIKFKFKK